MTSKILDLIRTCITCIEYQPKNGKKEGLLNLYDKFDEPFNTIHLDHIGTFSETRKKHKYILIVVDGFAKYVRLFPTRTTNADEVIKHLTEYFNQLSVPKRIVTDRGSCFTSYKFKNFLESLNIKQTLTAAYSPQSNGQAERMNRDVNIVISKLVSNSNHGQWNRVIKETEFIVNNTINRSLGTTPSKALFGVNQRVVNDEIESLVEFSNDGSERNLTQLRNSIVEQNRSSSLKNKECFDRRRIVAHRYHIGDLVYIKNVVTMAGINQKLLPSFRGPFKVTQVLPNDRYVIENIPGSDERGRPFKSVYAAFNIKPYISNNRDDCTSQDRPNVEH